jgi:hypothetical protein
MLAALPLASDVILNAESCDVTLHCSVLPAPPNLPSAALVKGRSPSITVGVINIWELGHITATYTAVGIVEVCVCLTAVSDILVAVRPPEHSTA